MPNAIPRGTVSPPPGRPSWGGGDDLPLLDLGWGQRDFSRDPLAIHYDPGTHHYLLLRGEFVVRREKAAAACRLIREEGWQVKAVAHHLGYRASE